MLTITVNAFEIIEKNFTMIQKKNCKRYAQLFQGGLSFVVLFTMLSRIHEEEEEEDVAYKLSLLPENIKLNVTRINIHCRNLYKNCVHI